MCTLSECTEPRFQVSEPLQKGQALTTVAAGVAPDTCDALCPMITEYRVFSTIAAAGTLDGDWGL